MAAGSALREQPSSVVVKWRLESGRKVERGEGDGNTESGYGIGMGEFCVN
jgi:hypothetical protein